MPKVSRNFPFLCFSEMFLSIIEVPLPVSLIYSGVPGSEVACRATLI